MNTIKHLIAAVFFSSLCLFIACSNARKKQVIQQQQSKDTLQKTLIVYLSRTGNTKAVAELIQSKMGGDLVALELAKPYPKDYQKNVEQVDAENERGYLPPLKTSVNVADYDVVFIGFPTWDMQVPPPVKTFLSENNWAGKVIAPFNTNAGYGLGSSQQQFELYCSEGSLKEIFSVKGGQEREGILYVMKGDKAEEVSGQLDIWLKKIGMKSGQ